MKNKIHGYSSKSNLYIRTSAFPIIFQCLKLMKSNEIEKYKVLLQNINQIGFQEIMPVNKRCAFQWSSISSEKHIIPTIEFLNLIINKMHKLNQPSFLQFSIDICSIPIHDIHTISKYKATTQSITTM